jgi:asparagine synthetase B (glutamine-hydrolysing)
MCGVLLVQSQHPIELAQHLEAAKFIQPRGPDRLHYRYQNGIFIAQSVLEITGDATWYDQTRPDFLAYNGEIYNYRWFGSFHNDTELVYHSVRTKPVKKFRYFEGAWAWVYTNFVTVDYATDPQGERCLYRYQDADILIVSSEVSAILAYRDLALNIKPYQEKHWPVRTVTPWQGIERIQPGVMYSTTNAPVQLDSVFDWRQANSIQTEDEAWEEFDPLWQKVMRDMTPTTSYAVTASGGLDSSVILAALPGPQGLYTINTVGKDSISAGVSKFLTEQELACHVQIDLDPKQWAQKFQDIVTVTRMPVQSWSFVGQWAIAERCEQRVLFTGVGADELFGGYGVYQRLQYSADHSASPYSDFAPNDHAALQDWQRCLAMYDGDARPATLLMDYLTQICAVDMRGVDTLTMAHGIEPRSPFCHPNIIKFALNLPWHLRLGKPLVRRLFLQRWTEDLIAPKQGFAGHCNDSAQYLGTTADASKPRQEDWKRINQEAFQRIVTSL